MKIIDKTKQFTLQVWHTWYVKYLIVCIIGVLIVGFFDENSVLAHMQNKQRIRELKAEIEHYEDLNDANKKRIKQLETDPKAMEKIARERYFMKSDDEDIFVLSDDEKPTNPIVPMQ
jgi:cell division protein FtsB